MSWSLARVADLRDELRLPVAAAAADERRLLRLLEEVSAGIELAIRRRLRRQFLAVTVVDGQRGAELPIPEHAVVDAVDVDLDGDGVHELAIPTAMVERVRFGAPVLSGPLPIVALRLLSVAPISSWPGGPGRVRVTGMLGFGDLRAPVGTLPAAVGATDTQIALPSAASPGDTLIVDTERVYVRSSAGEVERGAGGTTPAAHAAGAPVDRETWPPSLVRAALLQAARLHREGLEAYASAGGGEWMGPSMAAMYPLIRDYLAPFRREPVGIG